MPLESYDNLLQFEISMGHIENQQTIWTISICFLEVLYFVYVNPSNFTLKDQEEVDSTYSCTWCYSRTCFQILFDVWTYGPLPTDYKVQTVS